MKAVPAAIEGVFVIESEPAADARGSFGRTYCREEFRRAGLSFGTITQTSRSSNAALGTLRGLHWQAEPGAENKLVKVARGKIFDVAVDLRPLSPTFRHWFGLELDADGGKALLIPKGCAHGFVTLTPDCLVDYAMDQDYAAELARGARWNDPAFAIQWPIQPSAISPRDLNWPDFRP
ncbi:MAG TPA: dTDP-4-dehydrorhamnose 3,5-epimerase family protein [Rhizomicrobium sp.]|nr:dTDP-4-dehydrorhamnose 3,5-epimerase family protein [Rhizomicrobium sp.]HWC63138.1 dTDP-4-dehydrorhamnose 3,5-epimerase family protein [Rhizomicrobium sp.]